MKKNVLTIIIILGLIAIVLGETSNLLRKTDSNEQKVSTPSPSSDFLENKFVPTPSRETVKMAEKCSNEVKGLVFCTNTPSVIVKSGDQVKVNVSLKNISSENIIVPQTGGFKGIYNVVVTDNNGERILSNLDKLEIKQQEGTIKSEEKAALLPTNSGMFTLRLAPQETKSWELNLDEFYDFRSAGKYKIKISRKMTNFDNGESYEIPLDKIEINVH